MTREEYLAKKEEVKQLAGTLKYLKGAYKDCQRNGEDVAGWTTEKGKHWSQVYRDKDTTYTRFRVLHVFMSLVRGKTRTQIENTFEAQDTLDWLEAGIGGLCEEYRFEADHDEKGRVISIEEIAQTVAS